MNGCLPSKATPGLWAWVQATYPKRQTFLLCVRSIMTPRSAEMLPNAEYRDRLMPALSWGALPALPMFEQPATSHSNGANHSTPGVWSLATHPARDGEGGRHAPKLYY